MSIKVKELAEKLELEEPAVIEFLSDLGIYVNDIDGSIIFSKDEIQNKDYRRVDTFDKMMGTLDDLDYNEVLKNAKAYAFSGQTNELMDFAEKLSKSKFRFPYVYVEQLIKMI